MDKSYRQQEKEITEHHLYKQLAVMSKDEDNTRTFNEIADQELGQNNFKKGITGKEAEPN